MALLTNYSSVDFFPLTFRQLFKEHLRITALTLAAGHE